jgi:hypothetical protein
MEQDRSLEFDKEANRAHQNELRVSAARLPLQKLGWTERGGERASGGMLWNFQLGARA